MYILIGVQLFAALIMLVIISYTLRSSISADDTTDASAGSFKQRKNRSN